MTTNAHGLFRALATLVLVTSGTVVSATMPVFASSSMSPGPDPPPASGSASSESPTRSSVSDSLSLFRSFRTYAAEDTVPPLYFVRNAVEVEAQRVSLDEILRRCIDAERTKYDNVEDLVFTTTQKVVFFYGDPDDPRTKRTIDETVSRFYHKRSRPSQIVKLGEREYTISPDSAGVPVRKEEDLEDGEIHVRVSTSRDEITDIPFFFEDLSDYRFSIRERHDLDDRVLYRIVFEPRSDFKPLPTGEFWIDTTDFRIFHTELTFNKNVPAPLILKGVDHVAIEMKKIDDLWVYDRMAARIRLRKIPLIKIPQVVELVVDFHDHAINQGIPDEIFTQGAP